MEENITPVSRFGIKNSGAIISAAILGFALVAGTAIVGYTMYHIRSLSNNISVTGSAERIITSDVVKWTGDFNRNVSIDGLKGGYSLMARDLSVLQGYLKDAGVSESQLSIKPISLIPTYESSDKYGYGGPGKVIGYSIRQSVVVESPEVQKVTKLSQDAPGKLIESGVVFSTQNIEYYYKKFADLKVEMLADATKNARERASRIAESTGSLIDVLQSASMGVFQVTSVNSTEVSDYGFFDTSSIEKKVTSVVRASFSLK